MYKVIIIYWITGSTKFRNISEKYLRIFTLFLYLD